MLLAEWIQTGLVGCRVGFLEVARVLMAETLM